MSKHAAVPFVAPFAAFIVLLGLRSGFSLNPRWEYPFQVVVVTAVVLLVSRQAISWRIQQPLSSIGVGVAVFAIWIGPDLLFPGYRHHWIFENSLMGSAASSLHPDVRLNETFLAFRIFGTALLVPVVEELFWRGWLMRYLINPDFQKVPLGSYSGLAFWATAVLFATEHGPYWEVGLAAGLLYNLWVIRTRNLMDCIVAHSVTNALLAVYVVGFGRWEYWL